MFTIEQREALRDRLLRLAEEDERVVAGAAVGSLAVDEGDRFSDLDLTFGIADRMPVSEVLNDWKRTLVDELDAVHLADLERGPTIYRVFLLPNELECDLSMTPAAQFRPAGPRFRLLFGETAAGEPEVATPVAAGDLFIPTPAVAGDIFGWGVIYALQRARASNAGACGRPSITLAPCATTPSRLHASARACPRCRRAATTTFRLRPSLDSSMPTSGRPSLQRSAQPSPHPFSRSFARARGRVYRTRILSRSALLNFAELGTADDPAIKSRAQARLQSPNIEDDGRKFAITR